jgi:hypothetical protein
MKKKTWIATGALSAAGIISGVGIAAADTAPTTKIDDINVKPASVENGDDKNALDLPGRKLITDDFTPAATQAATMDARAVDPAAYSAGSATTAVSAVSAKSAASPVSAQSPKSAASPVSAQSPKSAPSPVSAPSPKSAPSPVSAPSPKSAPSPVSPASPASAHSAPSAPSAD